MKKCQRLTEVQKQELKKYVKSMNDATEVRRAQSVLLVDSKTPYEVIETISGYRERSVLKYRKRYQERGLKGLENKRKKQPKSLLTGPQRTEIMEILNRSTPREYSYDSDFWTTSILADFIQKKYNVLYKTKKPIYLLFKGASFSFHKPGRVYEKRDEEKVKQWKETVRSSLDAAFYDENTIILCEDEMILSTQTTFQKIWLKKGEYPKIQVSNTRKNRSLYGFLNIKTGKAHVFVQERQNMYITVDVLKNIRQLYPHKTILIVWDNAGWHHGSEVMQFIENDGNINLLFFPPYSPEENPQEHVWKAGRSSVTHNKYIPDIDQASLDFKLYIESRTFPYKLLHLAAPLTE